MKTLYTGAKFLNFEKKEEKKALIFIKFNFFGQFLMFRDFSMTIFIFHSLWEPCM